MESQGFVPEDFEETIEVWPDNWSAWCLWTEIRGQWRVGMAGAYALDYGPLFHRMDRMQLPPDGWQQMFEDIRVIEATALQQMRAKD